MQMNSDSSSRQGLNDGELSKMEYGFPANKIIFMKSTETATEKFSTVNL